MPNHLQSREEREFSSATDVVASDLLDVDPETPADYDYENPKRDEQRGYDEERYPCSFDNL